MSTNKTWVKNDEKYTRRLIHEIHSLLPKVVDRNHEQYVTAKTALIDKSYEFLLSPQVQTAMCPHLYDAYTTAIRRCLYWLEYAEEQEINLNASVH